MPILSRHTLPIYYMCTWPGVSIMKPVVIILVCCFCSRLPAWMRSYIPKIFYVEEKAWNFYPFTITGNAYYFIDFETSLLVVCNIVASPSCAWWCNALADWYICPSPLHTPHHSTPSPPAGKWSVVQSKPHTVIEGLHASWPYMTIS